MVRAIEKVNDIFIDTSNFSINLLKKQLESYFNNNCELKSIVRIISFGYKYGLPREADMVFDMRFIKNPFYQKNLSQLTGEDDKVKKFVIDQKSFQFFFKNFEKTLIEIFLGFKEEGKNFITIAFGCTGGVHRSVVSAIHLYSVLQKNKKFEINLDHRDLNK